MDWYLSISAQRRSTNRCDVPPSSTQQPIAIRSIAMNCECTPELGPMESCTAHCARYPDDAASPSDEPHDTVTTGSDVTTPEASESFVRDYMPSMPSEIPPEPETIPDVGEGGVFLQSHGAEAAVQSFVDKLDHPVSKVATGGGMPTGVVSGTTSVDVSPDIDDWMDGIWWDPIEDQQKPIRLRGPADARRDLVGLFFRGAKSLTPILSQTHDPLTSVSYELEVLLLSMKTSLGVDHPTTMMLQSEIEIYRQPNRVMSRIQEFIHSRDSLTADDFASIIGLLQYTTDQPLQLGVCRATQLRDHDAPTTYSVKTVDKDPHRPSLSASKRTIWVINNAAPSEETFGDATATGHTGQDYGDATIEKWSAVAYDSHVSGIMPVPDADHLRESLDCEHLPEFQTLPSNKRKRSQSYSARGSNYDAGSQQRRSAASIPVGVTPQPTSVPLPFHCHYAGCKWNEKTGKSLANEKGLLTHVRKVHETKKEDRRIPCELAETLKCKERFFDLKDERKHREVHTRENRFHCLVSDCSKSKSNGKPPSMRLDNAERHYKKVHPGLPFPPELATHRRPG